MTSSLQDPADSLSIRRVCVVANPVSGTNRAALETIQKLFDEQEGLEWQLRPTQKSGDAKRFATEAAEDGVDAVIACGGDGTVMEVGSGLQDTSVPMGIIPTGTANVMSVDLGIPASIPQAAALILAGPNRLRAVDMGCIDNAPFMLRVGMGYEAEISVGASRQEKARYGRAAYWRTAWRKLRGLQPTQYRLTLDGEMQAASGVTCLICNSSNIGLPNWDLVQGSSVDDGLLDVIVVHDMKVWSVLGMVAGLIGSRLPFTRRSADASPALTHWQAAKVTVESRQRQTIASDGEPFKRGKRVTAYAIPGAVRVIVPAPAQERANVEDQVAVDRVQPTAANAAAAGAAADAAGRLG